MKTYRCKYLTALPGEEDDRRSKIEAESPRAAYRMFLEEHGKHPIVVIVCSGLLSTEEFSDHVEEAKLEATQNQAVQAQKAAMLEASEVKRQAMHNAATEDAEASLSSTDILLKQQIAKLEEIRVIAVWFWWWFIGLAIIGIVLFLLLLTGAVVMGGR